MSVILGFIHSVKVILFRVSLRIRVRLVNDRVGQD